MTAAPRASLDVETDPASGAVVATFAGELDLVGVDEVAAPLAGLLARAGQPLLLDLAGLRFLDSSGLAVLIRLANRFRPVRTRGASAAVRRVIDVLGLHDRLGVEDT